MQFLDLLQEASRSGTPNCRFYVHVGHPVNEITDTYTEPESSAKGCVTCVLHHVWISQANLHLCRMRWVWKEQILLSSHWRGSFSSDLWWIQSEHIVHNKPSGLHIHQHFQTFPLQPLTRDLHSQGRLLALKETKFPQPFFFFFKTTSMLGHSFFSSVFNFRENLCLILYLGALNMDV